MRLVAKRPGGMSFIDSASEETVLRFVWKDDGTVEMAFRLYDGRGHMVSDSGGCRPVAAILVTAEDGDVLLDIPKAATDPIRYRLYSCKAVLLTASDGLRTQVYPSLKMEGDSPSPRRVLAASKAHEAASTAEEV